MIILGIDNSPASAAIMIDGRITSAIAEERLCRKKLAQGTPRKAISMVISESGISPADIDMVAVSSFVDIFTLEAEGWPGWFESRQSLTKEVMNEISSSLAPIVGKMPIAWEAHHASRRFLSRGRLKKIPALLRDKYQISAPTKFFDHHYCHATSAYYTSNFNDALVVTLDGGGDGKSGSVFVAHNDKLEFLHTIDSFNSLGNFYSYITALCGFKAEKHEGKITGLAAFGKPIYADILREFIAYKDPGQIYYKIPVFYRSALTKLKEKLPVDFDKAALAASIQLVLEETAVSFIQYWLRKTGMRNLAVAGGVFANVKLNQRLHEMEEVDSFFVHPAMDDTGLPVGAAFAAFNLLSEHKHDRLTYRLPNVYLGPCFTEERIRSAVESSGCVAKYEINIHKRIATLLSQGKVVARFEGRMEYGPRALGHRSIMYQTTDPTVNAWLNEKLNRTEFMPFAPATLFEYAQQCYENLCGAEDASRFMTITFDCTPTMKEMSPSVVHIDGTARPQIVDKDTAPDFYQILTEYHKITGIPSLINTSFNMHEEPIVCTPEEAIKAFQQGNLDYLAIGNWILNIPEEEKEHYDLVSQTLVPE